MPTSAKVEPRMDL